ncbi:hypothetical protein GPECTOR_7g907 [Gonium pectorale]|uniref:Uncharacterized protein n=1 Tax=Gonium pectorale TaxID=33097 RepID=A0A150GUB3_GONPE|nr:hypothetical protein GPECTOR_7g907 [Gonium pectorale]|eukprot:KXZ53457.1 hypothetical protein GPECTOR_7g907 [Gonium pectorale]
MRTRVVSIKVNDHSAAARAAGPLLARAATRAALRLVAATAPPAAARGPPGPPVPATPANPARLPLCASSSPPPLEHLGFCLPPATAGSPATPGAAAGRGLPAATALKRRSALAPQPQPGPGPAPAHLLPPAMTAAAAAAVGASPLVLSSSLVVPGCVQLLSWCRSAANSSASYGSGAGLSRGSVSTSSGLNSGGSGSARGYGEAMVEDVLRALQEAAAGSYDGGCAGVGVVVRRHATEVFLHDAAAGSAATFDVDGEGGGAVARTPSPVGSEASGGGLAAGLPADADADADADGFAYVQPACIEAGRQQTLMLKLDLAALPCCYGARGLLQLCSPHESRPDRAAVRILAVDSSGGLVEDELVAVCPRELIARLHLPAGAAPPGALHVFALSHAAGPADQSGPASPFSLPPPESLHCTPAASVFSALTATAAASETTAPTSGPLPGLLLGRATLLATEDSRVKAEVAAMYAACVAHCLGSGAALAAASPDSLAAAPAGPREHAYTDAPPSAAAHADPTPQPVDEALARLLPAATVAGGWGPCHGTGEAASATAAARVTQAWRRHVQPFLADLDFVISTFPDVAVSLRAHTTAAAAAACLPATTAAAPIHVSPASALEAVMSAAGAAGAAGGAAADGGCRQGSSGAASTEACGPAAALAAVQDWADVAVALAQFAAATGMAAVAAAVSRLLDSLAPPPPLPLLDDVAKGEQEEEAPVKGFDERVARGELPDSHVWGPAGTPVRSRCALPAAGSADAGVHGVATPEACAAKARRGSAAPRGCRDSTPYVSPTRRSTLPLSSTPRPALGPRESGLAPPLPAAPEGAVAENHRRPSEHDAKNGTGSVRDSSSRMCSQESAAKPTPASAAPSRMFDLALLPPPLPPVAVGPSNVGDSSRYSYNPDAPAPAFSSTSGLAMCNTGPDATAAPPATGGARAKSGRPRAAVAGPQSSFASSWLSSISLLRCGGVEAQAGGTGPRGGLTAQPGSPAWLLSLASEVSNKENMGPDAAGCAEADAFAFAGGVDVGGAACGHDSSGGGGNGGGGGGGEDLRFATPAPVHVPATVPTRRPLGSRPQRSTSSLLTGGKRSAGGDGGSYSRDVRSAGVCVDGELSAEGAAWGGSAAISGSVAIATDVSHGPCAPQSQEDPSMPAFPLGATAPQTLEGLEAPPKQTPLHELAGNGGRGRCGRGIWRWACSNAGALAAAAAALVAVAAGLACLGRQPLP